MEVDPRPGCSTHHEFRKPASPQRIRKLSCGNGDELGCHRWSVTVESSSQYLEGPNISCKRSAAEDSLESGSPKKRIRKIESVEVGNSSPCSSEGLCSESNGCIVYLSPVDSKDFSDGESIYSVQSKVTEIVKDSSDDLWFLEEDSDGDTYSVDIYEDEFELISNRFSESDSDRENGVSSPEDVIVICDESDIGCFADCEWSGFDDSSSDDEDLLPGDKWLCLICEHTNGPLHRFCESCWTLRPDWLAKSPPAKQKLLNEVQEEVNTDHQSPGVSGYKETKATVDLGDHACSVSDSQFSSDADVSLLPAVNDVNFASISDSVRLELPASYDSGVGSLSAETPSSSSQIQSQVEDVSSADLKMSSRSASFENSSQESGVNSSAQSPLASTPLLMQSNSCIICLSQPKEATIVHGKTGHQSCCYKCARRLKRCHRPCPVCRRTIQKVVRNYIV